MGSAKAKGLVGAVGTATAVLATEARPVASVAWATSRPSGTPATWCVQVRTRYLSGLARRWALGRVGGNCLPVLMLPLHPTACFGPCARCSGPEESHCLQCRKGWALHNLKCVGE